MKKKNIVTRTLEEVLARRRRGYSGVDSERVNAMTPEDIERLAEQDDKRLGIDPEEWGEARRVDVIPDGRQKPAS